MTNSQYLQLLDLWLDWHETKTRLAEVEQQISETVAALNGGTAPKVKRKYPRPPDRIKTSYEECNDDEEKPVWRLIERPRGVSARQILKKVPAITTMATATRVPYRFKGVIRRGNRFYFK